MAVRWTIYSTSSTLSKHRLTPKLLYSDHTVFIDVFGNAHRGGKQITHNKAGHVEVGKLWKDPDD